MFKTILVILACVVGIFIFVVASRPAEFSITRSATFSAQPEKIFSHINNLHQWKAWSPWAKLDPKAQESFQGPEEGVGALMKWVGNKDVGEGSMLITESQPHELIRMDLDFLKPFKASNRVEFILRAQGNQTVVQWSMSGKNNFFGKAISLVMNCDKMVGGQFEKGLANLKSVSEA